MFDNITSLKGEIVEIKKKDLPAVNIKRVIRKKDSVKFILPDECCIQQDIFDEFETEIKRSLRGIMGITEIKVEQVLILPSWTTPIARSIEIFGNCSKEDDKIDEIRSRIEKVADKYAAKRSVTVKINLHE